MAKKKFWTRSKSSLERVKKYLILNIRMAIKSFFLKSGKYKQIYNRIYFSDKMQNIKIKNKDSMLWGDSILKKNI